MVGDMLWTFLEILNITSTFPCYLNLDSNRSVDLFSVSAGIGTTTGRGHTFPSLSFPQYSSFVIFFSTLQFTLYKLSMTTLSNTRNFLAAGNLSGHKQQSRGCNHTHITSSHTG